MLYCDSDIETPAGRPDTLTPWMFKALPAEAHADLRRRYRTLELMFRVPSVDLTGLLQPVDWVGPAAPGELPVNHPAGADPQQDVDPDEEEPLTVHDDGSRDEEQSPPLLPGLLLYGRAELTATVRAWWKHWAKRTAQMHPGLLLRKAARANEGLQPVGALADWMRHLGWSGEQLTPGEVSIWLGRWTAEQDQRKSARLTPWQ